MHISGTTIQAGTVGVVTAQKPDKHGQLCTYIRFEGQSEDIYFSVTTTSPSFRKLPKGASPVSPSPASQPAATSDFGKYTTKCAIGGAILGALISASNGWDMTMGAVMFGIVGFVIGIFVDMFMS